ncbi:Fibrillin-2 [Nymphon striatum]|nr:Fibrillin-2 [Nymphon striatum]
MNETLLKEPTVTLGAKGCAGILKASEQRQSDVISNPEDVLHIKCRQRYINPKVIQQYNRKRAGASLEQDSRQDSPHIPCRKTCLNGGKCAERDQCKCLAGYSGEYCEQHYRTGPCFRQVRNDFCQNELSGVVCTKQLCCSTIGKAWGHPCEKCPAKPLCPKGYIKNINSEECQEVDECEAIPAVCNGGECVNSIGSFSCTCQPGYVRNILTNACEDENECDKRPDICKNGKCYNTPGDYFCSCQPGYIPSQDRKLCIAEYEALCHAQIQLELNECDVRRDLCENGECINTAASFLCKCFDGFTLSSDKTQCLDIDECEQFDICQNGRCINNLGSFQCLCNPGFDLTSDNRQCVDQNECEVKGMCANGLCVNMDGSYKCECYNGFRMSPTGRSCVDINECVDQTGICVGGDCQNTDGSFKCVCPIGYELSPDGAVCSDQDECDVTGMCLNGACQNMDGGYKCICNSGYTLVCRRRISLLILLLSVLDVDECLENPRICYNGRCENLDGSYRCHCSDGFTVSTDGKFCLDTQKGYCYSKVKNGKCRNPSNMLVTKSSCCCGDNSESTSGWGSPCQACPKPGSYEYDSLCPCGPGSGHECQDINECTVYMDICPNAACENLKGGYRCICNSGYETESDGQTCIDINECAVNLLLCENGYCRNTPGSFQCVCKVGYQFNANSKTCHDINECMETSDELCKNGICLNTEGSFGCECSPGMVLDATRTNCIDNRQGSCWLNVVNGQCEDDVKIQMLRSECCSTIGKAWGSPCQLCDVTDQGCPKGYAQTYSSQCLDVNECTVFPNICGGGLCVNTDGSYKCNCPPGLTLDPSSTKCLGTKEKCYLELSGGRCKSGLPGLYNQMQCCCTVGEAWGEACTPCPKVSTKAFQKLCKRGPGYCAVEIGAPITEVNECSMFPSLCTNGRCRNNIGSFTCSCNPGYAPDATGYNCADIDECSIARFICENGECQNLPGSFKCKCNSGYTYTPVMRDQMCVDIDECATVPGLCKGGICINTPGSCRCECDQGHELTDDGLQCKDVDECSRTSGICSNGFCENMMGTFQCVCHDGYEQSSDYTTCHDIDECEEDVCLGGKCTNLQGTYSCKCEDGLMPGLDTRSCLDIDECQLYKDICRSGKCKNTIGSYICDCEPGFAVKDDKKGCTDVNECKEVVDACDINADCFNSIGSYKCSCRNGFQGDGFSCIDNNECLRNNGGCHQNAACTNLPGSFECVCDDGFSGDGNFCRDIDECAVSSHLCDNGQCLNFPGGYRCECDMGFTPQDNEQSCSDINECEMFNNICVYGTCENIFGMFQCICDEGFQLDESGGNCTDIDECKNIESCLSGTCINKHGYYICQCPPNYQITSSGNGCIDLRESVCYLDVRGDYRGRGICSKNVGEMSRASCCCTIGAAWGSTCELCPKPNTTEFDQLCPGGTGFRPNNVTVIAEDINECEEFIGICKGGRCSDTFGSYMCTCPRGFTLDKTISTCVDENECLNYPDICGAGTCVNSQGSYHCVCPPKFMSMSNEKECIDMRKGLCFRQYQESDVVKNEYICDYAIPNNQTRMACCCSIGKAWGDLCDPCPSLGTDEYQELCSHTPGTVIQPDGKRGDVNECDGMVCHNGRCFNTIGSFICQCYSGYVYDELMLNCEDIDECNKQPSPCFGNNARCVNTPGSYICECSDGYQITPDQRNCVDIDECRDVHFCDKGKCFNYQGSYQCICNDGYTLSKNKDRCIDVNECERRLGLCQNGTCQNTDGSFKCICNEGFQVARTSAQCIDINECKGNSAVCQNGRCKNTHGGFTCDCQDGFKISRDGRNCVDVNECVEVPNICNNGVCRNGEGTFECICQEGYHLALNGYVCVDINECDEIPQLCSGGQCQNLDGGFTCICPPGYMLSSDKIDCFDMRKSLCYKSFEGGRCLNAMEINITRQECCCMTGSAGWASPDGKCELCPLLSDSDFIALCPDGFGYTKTGGGSMEDIDECLMDPTLCENGKCMNTDGSFRCICVDGFELDPRTNTCKDVNECRTSRICGNGTCQNLIGGFQCSCSAGFTPGSQQTCEDMNECIEQGSGCAFRCQNTPGSFRCVCPFGYTLAPDGLHCQDLDECKTKANNCKFLCKNLIGSFMCICPDGYARVGLIDDCKDINECETRRGLCENGQCVNTPGSHRCLCNSGYRVGPTGKQCIDTKAGYCYIDAMGGMCRLKTNNMMKVTFSKCCCGAGKAWGDRCQMCPRRGTEQYRKLCNSGGGFTPLGEDIDECLTSPHLCENGRCLNTVGSYRCLCNRGYKRNRFGTKCVDMDECKLKHNSCKGGCQNVDGSYKCTCLKGFSLHTDGITCIDIDECANSQHNCDGRCVNTVGSYVCLCKPGYRRVADTCIDVDECREGGGSSCGRHGTCINTEGSYTCNCQRGYTLDSTKTMCTDIDECVDGKCEEGCLNIDGGYRCQCPPGYYQHYYWNQCVDDDECTKPSVCGSASCSNTVGSYQCTCPSGYKFDSQIRLCIEVSGTSCHGAPCAFGCKPLGSSGYTCGCPDGYHKIGQGHCLSTVSPSGFHIDNGKDIISTEGCYSCNSQGNNRKKRSINRANSRPSRHYFKHPFPPFILVLSCDLEKRNKSVERKFEKMKENYFELADKLGSSREKTANREEFHTILPDEMKRYKRSVKKHNDDQMSLKNNTIPSTPNDLFNNTLNIYINLSEAIPGKTLMTFVPAIKSESQCNYVISAGDVNIDKLFEIAESKDRKYFLKLKQSVTQPTSYLLTVTGSYDQHISKLTGSDYKFKISIKIIIKNLF